MMGAISVLAQLAGQNDQLQHERQLAELRYAAFGHLVDAVINRRVDALKEGFMTILQGFADQARAYMDQQAKFADAELLATDPLQQTRMRSRLDDIDRQLASIRIDAQLVYHRMSEVILAIDARALNGFADELQGPLALTITPSGGLR